MTIELAGVKETPKQLQIHSDARIESGICANRLIFAANSGHRCSRRESSHNQTTVDKSNVRGGQIELFVAETHVILQPFLRLMTNPIKTSIVPCFLSSRSLDNLVVREGGSRLTLMPTWEEFEAAVATAGIALVGVAGPDCRATLIKVQELAESVSHNRLILLIEDRRMAPDMWGRLSVAAVVPLSEASDRLRATLEKVELPGDLRWVASAISAATFVHPSVKRAVKIVCIEPPPIPSIQVLARRVPCRRETLSRHWRKSFVAGLPIRLDQFLDWISLLWACLIHRQTHCWSGVAVRMEADVRTLRRSADRIGSSLVELEELGFASMRERFNELILSPLLDAPRGESNNL